MLNQGEICIVLVNKRWALSTLGANSKLYVCFTVQAGNLFSQDKSYLHLKRKYHSSMPNSKSVKEGKKKEGQYIPAPGDQYSKSTLAS